MITTLIFIFGVAVGLLLAATIEHGQEKPRKPITFKRWTRLGTETYAQKPDLWP